MGLPGRPGGDADALRAGARVWDHLAWEVWHLTRPLESRMTALLAGWSGPAGDACRARWEQVRQGLGEFDHRVHTCSDHLRRLGGHIEDAQTAYDHALGLGGVAVVAGVGLTLFTGGVSDLVAGEAEGAIGGIVAGIVAEFEAAVARLAALIGEMAELMGSLATRFAMEFEIRVPGPVVAAAGGAAANVAFTLADGDRDPRDVLYGAAVGAIGEALEQPGSLQGPTTPTKSLRGYGPPKPLHITDEYLQRVADQLYRPGASIGRGGTGDAIRAGMGHVQKGYDRAVQLQNWIERAADTVSSDDLFMAHVMQQDLVSALVGDAFPLVPLPW